MKKIIITIFLFISIIGHAQENQNIYKLSLTKGGIGMEFGYLGYNNIYSSMDFSMPCGDKDDGYLNLGIGYWPKTGMYETIILGLYSHGPAYHIPYQSDIHPNCGLELGYRYKNYIAGISFTNMEGFGIKIGLTFPNKVN